MSNAEREALHNLVVACEHQHDSANMQLVVYPQMLAAAKEVLARPESTGDLLCAIQHGIGKAITNGNYGEGSISLPYNMSHYIAAAVRERCGLGTSPSITRQQGIALLNRYVDARRYDRKEVQERDMEACLAAMNAPRMTREEAMKLLDKLIDAWNWGGRGDLPNAIHAVLAAMGVTEK